jgi:hypothetical protein
VILIEEDSGRAGGRGIGNRNLSGGSDWIATRFARPILPRYWAAAPFNQLFDHGVDGCDAAMTMDFDLPLRSSANDKFFSRRGHAGPTSKYNPANRHVNKRAPAYWCKAVGNDPHCKRASDKHDSDGTSPRRRELDNQRFVTLRFGCGHRTSASGFLARI